MTTGHGEDTNGLVGLIEERCPHRGASLFYGRKPFRDFGTVRTGDSAPTPTPRSRRPSDTD
jgi:hypothetical protein